MLARFGAAPGRERRHALDRFGLEASLEDIAGWVAPIATIIAAMMTAANCGARVTGGGFVVFTVGSLAWSLIGFASGQTNLLVTNGFLTVVNMVGVWRWLGRQRAYEDGGKSAEVASRHSPHPTLVTATGLIGVSVRASDGEIVGRVVEVLLTCESGKVSYIVVASTFAGVREELRAVSNDYLGFACDQITLSQESSWFGSLPVLDEDDWPAVPPKGQVGLATTKNAFAR